MSANPVSGYYLPGREMDARVADVFFRLATAGLSRCPVTQLTTGLVLQHLTQFNLADRPALAASQGLDRGPEVIAIVPASPAAAKIEVGDILLSINGISIPLESGQMAPFDASRARARADMVLDLLESADAGAINVTLARHGEMESIKLTPRPACPSRVHLARSGQLNAFADARHVFLTTAVLDRLQNDDELAFVIAHEVAHNVLGHPAIMHGREVKRGLAHTLGRSGQIVRQTERDADRLGAELLLDAGYDPVIGVEALKRLGGSDLGLSLFASHDPIARRIEAIHELVASHPVP